MEIFINLCDSHVEEIIKENNLDLIRIVLELSKCSPTESNIKFILEIGIVCDFWQKFSFILSDLQVPTSEMIDRYGNIVKELVFTFLKMIKYKNETFIELNQIDKNKIKDQDSFNETSKYRKTLKLFFEDLANFYSFNFIYSEILLPVITKTVNEIKQDINNVSAWADLETEIVLFACICHKIDRNSDLVFLDTIFDTMFEIPENLLQIRKKVADVIDEMGSMLSKRPQILMKAFNYLLLGTDNPVVSSTSY